MSDTAELNVAENWLENRQQIETAQNQAFVRHAIDNRGILTSTRQASEVATHIFELAYQFMTDEANQADITTAAAQLAEQGMAIITGVHMMQALGQATAIKGNTAVSRKLNDFQLFFLEKLANAREVVQQRVQEKSQTALQNALHAQLERQIASHETQKLSNQRLNEVLQLNARLSGIRDETALLDEAVSGICRALDLTDVTFYEYRQAQASWHIRTTTSADIQPGDEIPELTRRQLEEALAGENEVIQVYTSPKGTTGTLVTITLRVGQLVLGSMVANNDNMGNYEYEAYLILIRTFAQNLSALWQNLYLLSETETRAHELEILHGRYVDSIWKTQNATLQASYHQNKLQINRDTEEKNTNSNHPSIPLRIGERAFGQVYLPQRSHLDEEEQEFVQALMREMSNALNNAQFLQTARSYSNQLSVAAEVSRAATTILDRDLLIQEMVELIRARFNFYYVGLFLVDEKRNTAVLQAGTGEAGRIQVEQNHQLAIDHKSMIGTAIASGDVLIEQDVTQAKAFARNPSLPDTQSEIALPLQPRGRIIGALTVQSTELGAFSQDAVTVLRSLADQLAIAIENAELFAQTQQTLAETNLLYETSRTISEAKKEEDIYQTMVSFARQSGIVDMAQIIIVEPTAPDFMVAPVSWNRLGIPYQADDRFLRDKFTFSDRFSKNELILIEDGQTDPALDKFSRHLFSRNGLHAAAFLPIHVEEDWLGTLALTRQDKTPFTEQELQPFITLVDQAAVILANQRLLTQTDSLYQIGRSLNQAITRDDALNIAVTEVAKYTGASQCRIILYDVLIGVGVIAAEYVKTSLADSVQLPILGDYAYENLDKQRQPLLLEVGSQDVPPEVIHQHVTQFDAKASLLVPAASQHELIGFLAIDSQRGKRPFSPTNITFAQTVVDHLTTQLENIKLLDEALRRAQELITLNQIQANITNVLELKGLARSVYDQVGRLLDNTIFILARYEAETNTVEPIIHVVEGRAVETETRIVLPGEQLHQFLQGNQPYILDKNSQLMQEEYVPLPERIPESALWIPLRREGKNVGLISIQSYELHAYDNNDVQLLRSIATQSSLAIANAELFEKIQAQNKTLRELDQLKTQFLANMSHELRTPLNSIIGFSRVILKGIDGPITPEQEEDLTSIYNNGQHLLMLINEILDMAKIEAGKMTLTFEEIDLATTIEAVRTTVRSLINPDEVELFWDVTPDLPTIEADAVRIRQIFINLLSNAAKYTHEGEIHLKVTPEEEQIHITIRDTGIGIAPEDHDKLFTAFEQVDSSTTRTVSGTGLGLPITKWLVDMHQGDIYFESEVGSGTTFHVILPIRLDHEKEQEISLADSPVGLIAQQPSHTD